MTQRLYYSSFPVRRPPGLAFWASSGQSPAPCLPLIPDTHRPSQGPEVRSLPYCQMHPMTQPSQQPSFPADTQLQIRLSSREGTPTPLAGEQEVGPSQKQPRLWLGLNFFIFNVLFVTGLNLHVQTFDVCLSTHPQHSTMPSFPPSLRTLPASLQLGWGCCNARGLTS